MRHRIFIAINLPENTRKRLLSYQEKWPNLPIKWTYKDNLHITLLFLGYLTDEELLDVIRDAEKIITQKESFQISLNKIIYGPPKKLPPKMIWAIGETSEEFTDLQKSLEEGVYNEPLPDSEKREKGNYFTPHVTLGRLKSFEFNQMDLEEIPEINEDINLSFLVESIEIMESELKKNGPHYTILESFQLKN
jgi:2'-5' RNA ligase